MQLAGKGIMLMKIDVSDDKRFDIDLSNCLIEGRTIRHKINTESSDWTYLLFKSMDDLNEFVLKNDASKLNHVSFVENPLLDKKHFHINGYFYECIVCKDINDFGIGSLNVNSLVGNIAKENGKIYIDNIKSTVKNYSAEEILEFIKNKEVFSLHSNYYFTEEFKSIKDIIANAKLGEEYKIKHYDPCDQGIFKTYKEFFNMENTKLDLNNMELDLSELSIFKHINFNNTVVFNTTMCALINNVKTNKIELLFEDLESLAKFTDLNINKLNGLSVSDGPGCVTLYSYNALLNDEEYKINCYLSASEDAKVPAIMTSTMLSGMIAKDDNSCKIKQFATINGTQPVDKLFDSYEKEMFSKFVYTKRPTGNSLWFDKDFINKSVNDSYKKFFEDSVKELSRIYKDFNFNTKELSYNYALNSSECYSSINTIKQLFSRFKKSNKVNNEDPKKDNVDAALESIKDTVIIDNNSIRMVKDNINIFVDSNSIKAVENNINNNINPCAELKNDNKPENNWLVNNLEEGLYQGLAASSINNLSLIILSIVKNQSFDKESVMMIEKFLSSKLGFIFLNFAIGLLVNNSNIENKHINKISEKCMQNVSATGVEEVIKFAINFIIPSLLEAINSNKAIENYRVEELTGHTDDDLVEELELNKQTVR